MRNLFNKRNVRVFSWLLFIIWFIYIAFLSSQNGMDTNIYSEKFTVFFISLFHINKNIANNLHSFLRHIAHIIAFFILSGLLYYCLYSTINRKNIWISTCCTCSLIAIFDEVKKLFIFGRHCQFEDIGLNLLGILFFLCFIKFVEWIVNKYKIKNQIST